MQEKAKFLRDMLLTRQYATIRENKSNANTVHFSKEAATMHPMGRVTIEAVYPDGTTKRLLDEEENLVVKQAETIMPFMAVGLRQFSYIELGDPVATQAPALTDIALQQTTGQRKDVTYTITGNNVKLEALWDTTEGNGYSFTEAGLFSTPSGSGLLFARKVFNPIIKTNAFSLKFTWVIVFEIATGQSGGCTGVSIIGSSTVTSDYVYTALGGETEVIVPLEFTPGTKHLDVFLNTARLVYNVHYYESTIGSARGIRLIGFSLQAGDLLYIVTRTLL